jgi:hypothetical protein
MYGRDTRTAQRPGSRARASTLTPNAQMTVDENKALVRRLVEEAINARNLEVVDELADGQLADRVRCR